jgi:hypothetical protein
VALGSEDDLDPVRAQRANRRVEVEPALKYVLYVGPCNRLGLGVAREAVLNCSGFALADQHASTGPKPRPAA